MLGVAPGAYVVVKGKVDSGAWPEIIELIGGMYVAG